MLRFNSEGESYIDDDSEPVEFWPYSTVVQDAILRVPYKSGDQYDKLARNLQSMFQEAGFKDVQMDNKIAFGIKAESGVVYYFGFKDWVFTLGTSYRTDESNKSRKQKNEDK